MSTDDGKALVQDISAKIRILREQRDELAKFLDSALHFLDWWRDQYEARASGAERRLIENARALLSEVQR